MINTVIEGPARPDANGAEKLSTNGCERNESGKNGVERNGKHCTNDVEGNESGKNGLERNGKNCTNNVKGNGKSSTDGVVGNGNHQERNVKERKLTDSEIIGHSMTFLLAGYETTANTLSYTAYLLAINPHVQERLQDEIDDYYHQNPVCFGEY